MTSPNTEKGFLSTDGSGSENAVHDGTAVRQPTKRMLQFLRSAAECEPGKGFLPYRVDRRIAAKAVSDGFGMELGIGLAVIFIINEEGRAAVAKACGGAS